MRIIAPMMILIMMTSTLAGCTGGDPDGGGNDEIDMDILNQLIDDNLQDFINNTTITVENHYHNNTTNVNDNTDNSVSNVNGSVVDSVLNMFTVEWDWRDYLQTANPGEKIITLEGTDMNNTSNGGDSSLLTAFAYNGQTIEFRLNCNEFYHYDSYQIGDWEDWLLINYGFTNNQNVYDTSDDIYRWFSYSSYGNGIDANEQCKWDGQGIEYLYDIILYEINLEYGQAITILKSPANLITDVNCDDGFGTGVGNGTSLSYIGGQANCTVTGSVPTLYAISDRVSSGNTDDLGKTFMIHVATLYSSTYYPSVVPSFAVYFNLNDVDVYPIGE